MYLLVLGKSRHASVIQVACLIEVATKTGCTVLEMGQRRRATDPDYKVHGKEFQIKRVLKWGHSVY